MAEILAAAAPVWARVFSNQRLIDEFGAICDSGNSVRLQVLYDEIVRREVLGLICDDDWRL